MRNQYECLEYENCPIIIKCIHCGQQFCEYCCGKVRKEILGELGPWEYVCPHCYQHMPGHHPDKVEKELTIGYPPDTTLCGACDSGNFGDCFANPSICHRIEEE